MTSSASRSTSAPIMVQRRSSGPPDEAPPAREAGDVIADSGPSRTAPKSSIASIRAAKTTVTARAAPR